MVRCFVCLFGLRLYVPVNNFSVMSGRFPESQERLPVLLATSSANSSSCTTTINFLSYCYKNHWIKYCEKTYERERINYFWSIKNSTEILNKLEAKGFQASTISTYDFSTRYTTLPHDLIKN